MSSTRSSRILSESLSLHTSPESLEQGGFRKRKYVMDAEGRELETHLFVLLPRLVVNSLLCWLTSGCLGKEVMRKRKKNALLFSIATFLHQKCLLVCKIY